MKHIRLIFCIIAGFALCMLGSCGNAPSEQTLAGEWRFALDSMDVGIEEGWQRKELWIKCICQDPCKNKGKGMI